jgi:hypothetical protein
LKISGGCGDTLANGLSGSPAFLLADSFVYGFFIITLHAGK